MGEGLVEKWKADFQSEQKNPTMFLSDRSGMRHISEARPSGYPEGRGRGIAGSRPTRLGLSSAPVSVTWWTLSQNSKWKEGLGYNSLGVFLPDMRKVLGSTASITKNGKAPQATHTVFPNGKNGMYKC